MDNKLLTVKDVAKKLNIKERTVYDHAADLGGFFPAGIRKLMFNPGVINEHMEGQGFKDVAVQFRVPKNDIHGERLRNAPRSGNSEVRKAKRSKDTTQGAGENVIDLHGFRNNVARLSKSRQAQMRRRYVQV